MEWPVAPQGDRTMLLWPRVFLKVFSFYRREILLTSGRIFLAVVLDIESPGRGFMMD